jgi:DNA adenine methylase
MVTSRKIAAIPYYGGKFRLARHIVPIIESIPHRVYVEPCVGGASVFLWREADPKRMDVLNDIDQHVAAFYMAAKRHPQALIKSLSGMPYSRALFTQSPLPVTGPLMLLPADELVAIAASVYFVLCNSFCNQLTRTGINIDLTGHTNFPAKWQRRIVALESIISRFSDAYLENADCLAIVQKYSAPGALTYFDPPYPETRGYATKDFTVVALQECFTALDKSGGYFVASCYDYGIAPVTANLIVSIPLRDTVTKSRTRKEMLYISTPELTPTIAALPENATIEFATYLEIARASFAQVGASQPLESAT